MKKISLLIFTLFTINITAQDDSDLLRILENKLYSNKLTTGVILEYPEKENSLIPASWMDEFNTAMNYGIKNTYRFDKIYSYDSRSDFYNPKATHYLIAFDVFNLTIDNEKLPKDDPYRIYNYKKEANVVISGNLQIMDLVRNTTLSNLTLHFNEKGIPTELSEKFAKFIRENLSNLINKTFPLVYKITSLDEVKKDKAKSVFIEPRKYALDGKPEELYVYKFKETINAESLNPIPIMEYVGYLRSKKNNGKGKAAAQLTVKRGDKEIYQLFNEGVTLYTSIYKLGH